MREAICGMLCMHMYIHKTQLHLLTAWLKQQIKHSLIGPLQVYPPSCMPGKASISQISILIVLGALLNSPNPVTVIGSLALWGLSAQSSLKSSSPTDVHSSGPWNMSQVNSSHIESPRSSSPPSPNRLCMLLLIYALWKYTGARSLACGPLAPSLCVYKVRTLACGLPLSRQPCRHGDIMVLGCVPTELWHCLGRHKGSFFFV